MTEEYYEQNLFGEMVKVNLTEEEDDSFSSEGEEYKGAFNVFALTDSVGERDKRKSWTLYQKALASGMSGEEVFWRIVWAVKTMILVSKTKSAEEAEVKPFVYSKTKTFLKNWKPEELEKLSMSLVVGYHDARRGLVEIETLLEKILLTL